MKVELVPVAWVNRVWPTVAPYIAAALERAGGEYTVDHVQGLVTAGHWLLVVATEENQIHGAATINMYNRPTDRVAFVTTIGGAGITSAPMFEQLKAVAASQGATVIEGAVQESIARLWRKYGFEEKYRIVGARL